MKQLVLTLLIILSSCTTTKKISIAKESTVITKKDSFNKQKLDSLFTYLKKNDKYMGSITLSHNGTIIYKNAIGYDDIETQIESTVETKYRIGSISKLFTASLVMKAVEADKLDLNTTIENYFPSIKNSDIITIEDLLRHRSGIHNFTDDEVYETYYTNTKTRQEMIGIISDCGSDFEPKSKGAYSNSNYVLLTIILEKVFHTTINKLVETNISTPLNLMNTYYGSIIDVNNKECNSYEYSKIWLKDKETDMSIPLGAGAIVSNPSDLTKFIEALFNNKIVSKQSIDSMLNLTEMDDFGVGYGLGIFEYPINKKAYGHTGGIDSFSSLLLFFPQDDLSLAICSNGNDFSNNKIMKVALNCFYNEPIKFLKK